MTFREFYRENTVILDGALGTLLQNSGMPAGELPERLNLSAPTLIKEIHRSYFDAGSNVVNINTFGASILKFSSEELELIIAAAVDNAKRAREESVGDQPKFIALDIGPTGKLLSPLGDLEFEDAVAVFAKTVALGVKYGVDLITVETMNDAYETKAALLAVKENSDLPVIVTNAYGEDGKLMTGATPEAMCALIEGLGADMIGANCSFGPDKLEGVVSALLDYSCLPVVLKPNAGMPRTDGKTTVYDILPNDFADKISEYVRRGVRAVGGCCGTTPEYISALAEKVGTASPVPVKDKHRTVISSFAKAAYFGGETVLIGERLNPTGKRRLKEAIINGEYEYIQNEAISQEEAGAMALDVNVGVPGIDESEILPATVRALQSVTALPLVIDSASPEAIERAVRIYNGKPLINSVNGKEESMRRIFPIAKKYGAALIALTLDESGIPETKDGRIAIAKRILATAEKYGIDKKDIIFDTLTMAVSTDPSAASVTLDALEFIERELDVRTSLGVSNVSFGLPERDVLNAAFFTMAMSRGISGAIVNPHSERMKAVHRAFSALNGNDERFEKYISFAESLAPSAPDAVTEPRDDKTLFHAIVKGIKGEVHRLADELLSKEPPMSVITGHIIPALDEVGRLYECGKIYLPGLLMSAEAAKCAFDAVSGSLTAAQSKRGCVVIATVEGDIHDIGKNIVKMILENYGFGVIDLGKNVPAEQIVRAVMDNDADVVALSALMTTTAPNMKKTVDLLRASSARARVVVGGAVITEEYARSIGADAYGADAMAAVRYVKSVIL